MGLRLPLVLDTTVLSNFSHARRPDVVRHVSRSHALTTPTVMAELRAGVEHYGVPQCDWSWLTVVVLTPEEHQQAGEWTLALDPGEREALAVALYREGTLCSDDLAARRMATYLGVPVCGTIGVLIQAVREGALDLSVADGILRLMRTRGYRAPIDSLRHVLKQ